MDRVTVSLKISERRACAALGQHRSTQRKPARGRDDEAALTADIIAAGLHVPVREIANLRECDFGAREGHPKGSWYDA